jgi:nucleotide-binding universal stress UspA family protein
MGRWKQIVVGVDGSPASRTALEWARDEAVRHSSELVVLTAWLPTPPPLAGTSSTLPTHGAIDARETAKGLLMESIRPRLCSLGQGEPKEEHCDRCPRSFGLPRGSVTSDHTTVKSGVHTLHL